MLCLLQILEFNDFYNTSRIDEVNDKNISEINFKNFQWHHENMTKHDDLVQFYVYANSYKDQYNNVRSGNISFLVRNNNLKNFFDFIGIRSYQLDFIFRCMVLEL